MIPIATRHCGVENDFKLMQQYATNNKYAVSTDRAILLKSQRRRDLPKVSLPNHGAGEGHRRAAVGRRAVAQ